MPCKTSLCRSGKDTCRTFGEHKTKYACIVEAHESMRIRMEGSSRRYHEDRIAGKGTDSLNHHNYINLFLCLKQWKYQVQRQQWKKWEKRANLPAWQLTKVKNKTEVVAEAKNKGIMVHLASLMDLCHLKNCLTDVHLSFEKCSIGGKAPKIQRSSCTPRRFCERWFRIVCGIYRARIISITNDGCKSNGYYIETTRMRRTRSRLNIWLHPG